VESDTSSALPKPSRARLALILTPIVVAVVASYISAALLPSLVKNHPLLLIALNSRLRNVLLVANKLPFVDLLVVATLRRVMFDPFFYLLGRAYGPAGVRWAESKAGESAPIISFIDRWFHKVGWLFVMVYPGEIVCTLAGATKMSFARFISLNILGTVIFVTAVDQFASVFDGPVNATTGFIGRYALPLTFVTVAITIFYIWQQQRSGKSEIESVDDFARELEQTEVGTTSPESDPSQP
jgi:membrane protein DedA with SNARE-associated domain